jgi:hypothetical protein
MRFGFSLAARRALASAPEGSARELEEALEMVGRYPRDKFTPRPDDHFTFGLWTVGNRGAGAPGLGGSFRFSKALAARIKDYDFDIARLRKQGYEYERLDQLTNEVLWGIR